MSGFGGGFGGGPGPTGPAGPAGSANISGSTNKLVKFTGATTGGDSSVTDDGSTVTTTLAAVISLANTLLARAGGLGLIASSSSSASDTVQESPIVLWEGQVRVGGANRVQGARIVLVPRTSGALDLLIQYNTNVSGGGSWSTAARYTTSTAGQFVGAWEAAGFSCTTGTGLFFDADNSRFARGGSGDLNIFAENTSNALPAWYARSRTAAGGSAPFRSYAFATGMSGATQPIWELGINVASVFTRIFALFGDGVAENPRLHVDATVKTGDFTASLYTSHLVDLSGAAISPTIPAAAATNVGAEIEIAQVVAGTANLVITPASGTVEGAATLTLAGLASAPLRTVKLRSMGAAAGSPGWKVVALV